MPGPLFGRGKQPGQDLVRPGGEPGLDLFRVVGARQGGDRHDRGKGVALEPPDQPHPDVPELSPSTKRRQGCPRRTIDSTSSGWLNTRRGNAWAAAHWRTSVGTGQPSGEKKRIVGRVRTHCLS